MNLEEAAVLFNEKAHIYAYRQGKRAYVRLELFTMDKHDQALLTRYLGGFITWHLGYEGQWRVNRFSEVAEVLRLVKPYCTGRQLKYVDLGLEWATAQYPKDRWAVAMRIRALNQEDKPRYGVG